MPITLTTEYRQRLSARAVPGALWAWVLVDPTPRAAAVALKMFPDLAAQYPEPVAKREDAYNAAQA